MKEHDVVILTKDLPEHDLKAGSIGTIVSVHKEGQAFTVEFADEKLAVVYPYHLVLRWEAPGE